MGWGLMIKKFNIVGFHWKIWFLGGGGSRKNKYIERIALKGGLAQFADLNEGLAKKRIVVLGVFEGGWYRNAHCEREIFLESFFSLLFDFYKGFGFGFKRVKWSRQKLVGGRLYW